MNPTKTVLSYIALAPWLAAQSPYPGILLNEVHTGSPAFIEVVNSGASPVDLRGMCIWRYETRGNTKPCNPVPDGVFGLGLQHQVNTNRVLAPGATFVFIDGIAPIPACSVTIPRNIMFSDASEVEVWLNDDPNDPTTGIIDYVAFGDVETADVVAGTRHGNSHWSGGTVVRPRAGSDLIQRVNLPMVIDTNTATDWVTAPGAFISPCLANPLDSLDVRFLGVGRGYGESGNCASFNDVSTTTVHPTLTIDDAATSNTATGSTFVISYSVGQDMPGAVHFLLAGTACVPGGIPVPFPPCMGLIRLYLSAPTSIGRPLVFNGFGSVDLPGFVVPGDPNLLNRALCFQAVSFDFAATGACFLRASNGLQVRILP